MSTELAAEPVDDLRTAVLAPQMHDLARRPAASLEQVLFLAALTTRVERKYLVPMEDLSEILDQLPGQLAVLEIDTLRVFGYESVYFDTMGFALYRQHVQGRRQRYKTRIRSYCDTGDSMLEVKLKGSRGQTVKERLPYDFARRRELTCEGRAFLEAVVADAYGVCVPALQPALTTAYRRLTLVDLERGSRTTVDVNLSWSDRENSHRADHLALIETKCLAGPGPVDALLGALGVRPVRISKYCLGIALLHPDTAANPWSRVLRSQFGWHRADDPDCQHVLGQEPCSAGT